MYHRTLQISEGLISKKYRPENLCFILVAGVPAAGVTHQGYVGLHPHVFKIQPKSFPQGCVASGLCKSRAGSIFAPRCDPGKAGETWLGCVVQRTHPAQSGNGGGLELVMARGGFGDTPLLRSFKTRSSSCRCCCGEFPAAFQLLVSCLASPV